jgi:uncharacterized small protein (DUF1192 family)
LPFSPFCPAIKHFSYASFSFQRQARVVFLLEESKKLRDEISSSSLDIKERKERCAVLDAEVSRLPANVDRSGYTNRIVDITAIYSQHCAEVDRIASDIREVQKGVNSATNALSRADSVCEEVVYSAANATSHTESTMVDAYRQLCCLRSSFDKLIAAVEDVIKLEKLSRDLETKIDQEECRLSSNNLETLSIDLAEVQKENLRISGLLLP